MGVFVALNAATWVLQGGHLAWETHLGGFLAGAGLTALWRGKNRLAAQ
jgi:membrane associated rhomboid family serine protease